MKHNVNHNVVLEPAIPHKGTRFTWPVGTGVFEAYHEESECSMWFNTGELTDIIDALTELRKIQNKYLSNSKAKQPQSDIDLDIDYEGI